MASPKRRKRNASAPESLIKKADDRHPYGGVRSEPLKNVEVSESSKPKPKLKRRRMPRTKAEEPYPEAREKNEPRARR